MLRASIEHSGSDAALRGIAEGAKVGDAGIEHGERLTAFADAAVGSDPPSLATARNALRAAAGPDVVVDAAAVIGNFERMVRIADGTGIPLDNVVSAMASDLREALGINDYRTQRLASGGRIVKAFAPALRGVTRLMLRTAGRCARRSRRTP